MKETRDLRMVDLSIENAIVVDLIPVIWIVEKEETNIGHASIEGDLARTQIDLGAMKVGGNQRIMKIGEVKVQGVKETETGIVIETVIDTVTEIGKETEIEIETVTEIEIVTETEKGIAILNAEGAKKSAGKETGLAQAKLAPKTIGTKRKNLEHRSGNATPKNDLNLFNTKFSLRIPLIKLRKYRV